MTLPVKFQERPLPEKTGSHAVTNNKFFDKLPHGKRKQELSTISWQIERPAGYAMRHLLHPKDLSQRHIVFFLTE